MRFHKHQLSILLVLTLPSSHCSVSTLVLLLRGETKDTFGHIIKGQIRKLRKELHKYPDSLAKVHPVTYVNSVTLPPKPEKWELARTMAISAATSLGRSFI